jgi:uncharacterized membrane protein YccF (DUF307 family)
MRAIGNLIWFIFGGFVMGLGWWAVGCIAFLSIIGIPWGRACFVIGEFAFFPFGKTAVDRQRVTGMADIGTSEFGTLGNIIWFLVFGIWLAIGHLVHAFACFVTIIGIPFGLQHLKLAMITLAPIGKTIVSNAEATRL